MGYEVDNPKSIGEGHWVVFVRKREHSAPQRTCILADTQHGPHTHLLLKPLQREKQATRCARSVRTSACDSLRASGGRGHLT